MWYVHVWVRGHYAGAYRYDTLCAAALHLKESAAMRSLGCHYCLNNRHKWGR